MYLFPSLNTAKHSPPRTPRTPGKTEQRRTSTGECYTCRFGLTGCPWYPAPSLIFLRVLGVPGGECLSRFKSSSCSRSTAAVGEMLVQRINRPPQLAVFELGPVRG